MIELEQAARERHLTAVLEEALQGDRSEALLGRIQARLRHLPAPAPMPAPIPKQLVAAWMIAGIGAVCAVAGLREPTGLSPALQPPLPIDSAPQDPAPATPPPIVVGWRCVDSGAAAPRRVDGQETGATTWTGRQLVWRVGEREFDSTQGLAGELSRLVVAASRAPDGANSKRSGPPRLLLQPGKGAGWSDVVTATDAAMAAGFLDIGWSGVDTRQLCPKAIEPPVVAKGALLVPAARFHEPDDAPAPGRPVFDVYQDGRVEHEGKVLLAAAAGPDGDAVVEAYLRRLREATLSLLPAPTDKPANRVEVAKRQRQLPMLVRIDRGTEWRRVQRFLTLATRSGFVRLEFGVAARDVEAAAAGK